MGLHDRELINDLLRGTDTAQAGTESNPLWGDNAALCQDKGTPKISRSTTIVFFPQVLPSMHRGTVLYRMKYIETKIGLQPQLN